MIKTDTTCRHFSNEERVSESLGEMLKNTKGTPGVQTLPEQQRFNLHKTNHFTI